MQLLTTTIACVVIVACLIGMYREGMKRGYYKGAEDSFARCLKALCDGDIKVEGRKLIISEDFATFYDTKKGEFVSEIDMDQLEFRED